MDHGSKQFGVSTKQPGGPNPRLDQMRNLETSIFGTHIPTGLVLGSGKNWENLSNFSVEEKSHVGHLQFKILQFSMGIVQTC